MRKILVMILMVLVLTGTAYSEESNSFNLEINIGDNGAFYIDKSLAIDISVTNNGGDFEGYLKVFMPLESNSQIDKYYSYDYILEIAEGETKKIEAIESIDSKLRAGNAIVKLVSKNGSSIYEKNYRIRESYEIKTLVGVLSDDFDSLSYIKSSKTHDLVNLKELDLNVENIFDPYDVVIINYYDTGLLSENAIKSLEGFVDKGGQLIIGTGQYMNKSLKNLDFIGQVEISGTSELDADTIRKITAIEIEDDFTIKVSEIEKERYYMVNEIMYRKKIGQGSIIISKISLSEDIFNNSLEADDFVDRFVDYKVEKMEIDSRYRNDSKYYIHNYITKIPKDFMPNPIVISIFMLVFVILVGPGTYIFLDHIDKRDYGFIGIISIVIGSIIFINAYGYIVSSRSDIVNHISTLRAKGGNLSVESYIGYKGSKGDVDIAFASDGDISRFNEAGFGSEGGHIYSKYKDENNHIVFHDSKQWEFNKINVKTNEKFDEAMISPLKVDENKLSFKFENKLGYKLDQVFFVYGDRIYYKEGLDKDEVFNFSKDIKQMKQGYSNRISESIYGYNSVFGFEEDYFKSDILRDFLHSQDESLASSYLLLSTDEFSLDIKNKNNIKENKLAYIYIPLELEYAKGKEVKSASYFIREKVIESSGIGKNPYEGMYNGNGNITFEYKIPETLELSKLEVEMDFDQDISYEIYNQKAKIWEKLNNSKFTIDKDKIYNYLDKSVKIKVTSSDFIDFMSPSIIFEGVGK